MLDALKNLVEQYLGARKGRSRLTLAQESGVSYNTITRILMNDCSPSFESVAKLLRTVTTEDAAFQFLRQQYPDFADIVNTRTIREAKTGGAQICDAEGLEVSIQSRTRFEIICLALRPSGVQHSELQNLFGASCHRHLHDLLNLQVLREENGRYLCERFRVQSSDDVHVAITHILSSLVERHRELDQCHGNFETAGLNEDGLKAVLAVLRSADIELQKIGRAESFQGPHTVQVATLMSQVRTGETDSAGKGLENANSIGLGLVDIPDA